MNVAEHVDTLAVIDSMMNVLFIQPVILRSIVREHYRFRQNLLVCDVLQHLLGVLIYHGCLQASAMALHQTSSPSLVLRIVHGAFSASSADHGFIHLDC